MYELQGVFGVQFLIFGLQNAIIQKTVGQTK